MLDIPSPFTTKLPDWLTRRAATHGDQLSLLCGDVAWSFAELHARVGVATAVLAAAGVVAGDRVALLARNSPAFVVTVHALGRLGAVLAPLNARLAPEELAWQLAD
ncbi:MAG: AMP-binding protein, partial [Thermomicrobiales bacterium]